MHCCVQDLRKYHQIFSERKSKMGKNAPDVEDVPDYQTGTYNLGGASSTTTKNGNNITAQYTAAPGEQKSYDYIQNQLPSLYENATKSGGFGQEEKAYTDNQKSQLNDDFTKSLNVMKAAFGTSGQMKDSSSLDKLRPFEQAYLNSTAKVNAEAPQYVQKLRSNDQAFNTNALTNAQNGLNNYYSIGQNVNSGSLGLSNQGNQWSQQNYLNRRQHSMDQFASEQADKNAIMDYVDTGLQTAQMIAPMFL